MTDPAVLDRLRRRWRDQHERLGLLKPPSGINAPEPAGLGRRVADLSTRIVILPADPLANLLEFDDELWGWWAERRPAPFGKSVPWADNVPSAEAAVRVQPSGDTWRTFLALHRHGGVELGTADTYESEEQKCFRLIRTVGLLWLVLDAQAAVLTRVEVDGPWEITLALHDTQGAYLGDLGADWREPRPLRWDGRKCSEPHVVIREELDRWPDEPDALRGLAFQLGGRIEDAWGTRQRRFLDLRGEREGEFDPRRWKF